MDVLSTRDGRQEFREYGMKVVLMVELVETVQDFLSRAADLAAISFISCANSSKLGEMLLLFAGVSLGIVTC
eukprot:4025645-Ditylum_brightwellii.AAC.1